MLKTPLTFIASLAAALLACGGPTQSAPPAAQQDGPATPATAAPAVEAPQRAAVQDAVAAAPAVYTTLHEDARVRVVDMRLDPGVTDGIHSHPDEIVYFVKGGKAHIALPDGNAMDVDLPDGHVLSHEGWTHTVSNTGDAPIRAIIVELQQPTGKRAAVADGKRADQTSSDVYKELHSDERVRVLEMVLKAGQKDDAHGHPDEVVYFLKGGKARITLPDGKVMELEIPDGHILSNEAWEHTVENIGDTDIHAIIWELT